MLTLFLVTNKRLKFDDLHQMLSRNLSQTTGNLLRSRLWHDLDYSIARTIIDEEEEDDEGASQLAEDFDSYSEYLDVDPYYTCCYK